MKRNRTIEAVMIAVLTVAPASYAQQNDAALLDYYLFEIERLISADDLEGARQKLSEATAANLRDESLELIYSQLRLLEGMNNSDQTPLQIVDSERVSGEPLPGVLTEQDKRDARDLLDSLRIAMENGELEQVRRFSEATPQTDSLLTAVFQNYAGMKVEVSPPEADASTDSFLATLEFIELTTKDGSTAFPAQAWKTHRLRIIKSDGAWQKVLW